MDPLSIVGLVGSCATIAGRLASLVEAIPSLVTAFRDADRSIKRLGNQLQLFHSTVEELKKWLRRTPRVSERVKRTLRASLDSCQDIVADIERHVNRVTGDTTGRGRSAAARVRHVWDETAINQCEQRVLTQMQMIDIYVRMLHLNDPGDQDSILDSATTVTLIDRGNDDASTVRSTWNAERDDAPSGSVSAPTRRRPPPAPPATARKRGSITTMFKSLTLSKNTRQQLAEELLRACEHRNITEVHSLIKQGVSPNDTTWDDSVPFISAASAGDFLLVKTLLEYGANPSIFCGETEETTTPLYAAIHARSVAVVRLLIKYGAKVASNPTATEPLIFAAISSGDAEILISLLEAGADCEIHTPKTRWTGGHKRYPLGAAIDKGNVAMAQALLEFGSDVNQKVEEFPPLSFAIYRGQNVEEFVRLLLDRGADVSQKAGLVKLRARYYGNREWYFHEEWTEEATALHLLSQKKSYYPVLEMLLQRGADPNADLKYQYSFRGRIKFKVPPHDAGTPLHDAADDSVVKMLLKYGARINEPDTRGETPLLRALLSYRHRAALALIKAGAEVSAKELDYFDRHLPPKGNAIQPAHYCRDDDGRYTPGERIAASFLAVLRYLLAAGAERKGVITVWDYKDSPAGSSSSKTFLYVCNSLIQEARSIAPATRRAMFLRGETVLDVTRESPIGPEVKDGLEDS